ncbi:MAG: penicillin acylase family protein [Pseudomonadota bacterium]
MTLLLTWLLRIVAVIAALGAVALALGWYLVERSLPDFDARLRLQGLTAEVRVIRDANAVPRIRAETAEDAFFALGLVHAQDRLWQMELNRRAAQGRLSTLLGPRTTKLDRLIKTLDLYGHASRAVDEQSPEAKAALQAYADGVNAWIRTVAAEALGRGAPEFFVFATDGLAPWTPADSIGIMKMMALRLTGAARAEIRRARLLLSLPPERVADILPDPPEGGGLTLPRYAELFDGARFAAAEAVAEDPSAVDRLIAAIGPAPQPELAGASNAWAVDGSRATLGQPLLASDPHLWLSAPSLWYLADVQGGEGAGAISAIGGTLPGTPLVLIGHNGRVGWGLTTVTADDADLFIEQVDPDDPGRYRTPDGWERFRTRRLLIERDGAEPLVTTARYTRNGPVLDAGLMGAASITPDGHVAALRWTALDDEDRTVSAALALMRAETVDEAMQAAGDVLAPAQNVILADSGGDIGMVVTGALPRRRPDSPTQGRVPSPGWVAATAWEGTRSPRSAPRVVSPRSGGVANANNRVTDATFPNHIGHEFDLPYRLTRIEKELTAREFHSIDGFLALQTDVVSEMARAILPLIARDLWWRGRQEVDSPTGPERRRAQALALLADWNGAMDRHRPEPLIFAEWMRQLTRRLAADELGPLMPMMEGLRPLFVERVFRDIDGAGVWCDIDKTPEVETCQAMAAEALDDAMARLTRDYGTNVQGWRWGEAHVADHVHQPLGHVFPFGNLLSIRQETSGGYYTIKRGAMTGQGETPFENVHAAGLRMVLDFADLNRSRFVIATGQSGHPLSRHYDDQSVLWVRGDSIALSRENAEMRLGALGEMVLLPQSGE